MNFMAPSSKDYSNTSTNSLLDLQNTHHHHSHLVQFSSQLELHEHNQMAFTTPLSSTQPRNNNFINDFMRKYGSGAYDLTDYDQDFLFHSEVLPNTVDLCESSYALDHQPQSSLVTGMRSPTLNIFHSRPMHSRHHPSTFTAKTNVSTTTISSPTTNCSKRPSGLSNKEIISNLKSYAPHVLVESSKTIKREEHKKWPSSTSGEDHGKTTYIKTSKRLAQNREAARKSRLKRKAYVQQLESSRIKLTQLKQELQKAKDQGVYLGSVGRLVGDDQELPRGVGNISAEAANFNMDYAKWLEDYRLHMGRLRDADEKHLSDNEIRFYVDNCITHFDDLIHLKGLLVKTDVFHILSGMWKTPAERCFMWIGGFRPSELIKIIPSQIQLLTQQQYLEILDLQNFIVEAEEMLTKDLVKMNHSLSQAIVSENVNYPTDIGNYMGQMAASMEKLSNLEVIVHQADNLRLETIHRVHELMTTRQASRSLIEIGEYFHRLQSLSALWVFRDRRL